MKKLTFFFAIITTGMLCCLTDMGIAQVAKTQQPLSVKSTTLWPSNTVNVCWENPTPANATQRNLVRNAVRNTWEAESSVRLTGWNTCAVGERGIRILINDEGPHVNRLGRELDGMRNGMVLNFTFNNWSQGCSTNPGPCIYGIAVHEFGHALGIAHEQNRADCRCNDSPQGTNGDWVITPCDINSVMMYCNTNWNNNGVLSGYDVMGIRKLYGDPTKLYTVLDESGKLELTVFTNTTPTRTQHSDLRVTVPSDYLVVGGGGRATDLGNGALLTASYPSTDLSSWIVASKDHQLAQPHVLTGYAVGIRVKGLTRDQLRAHVIIKETESEVTGHPSATATLPGDFVLLGGGFKVNWKGAGNLATASFPNANGWTASSKDHSIISPASIVSYAIGIRRNIPNTGQVNGRIFSRQSDMKGHPWVGPVIDKGYVLTGGGGEVKYSGAGNLLWQLTPNISEYTNQFFEISSKDHVVASNAYIMGYSIGVKIK